MSTSQIRNWVLFNIILILIHSFNAPKTLAIFLEHASHGYHWLKVFAVKDSWNFSVLAQKSKKSGQNWKCSVIWSCHDFFNPRSASTTHLKFQYVSMTLYRFVPFGNWETWGGCKGRVDDNAKPLSSALEWRFPEMMQNIVIHGTEMMKGFTFLVEVTHTNHWGCRCL